ncbi:sensor domain-containing protein [Nocardia stercoris]|uniref:sensor domain-containing protein n=1 Tax=Nocardia stercoris TaxID=2483361 RepID=UPI001F2CF775|nr:diguanylate cyclase [Nocardia stercoris]
MVDDTPGTRTDPTPLDGRPAAPGDRPARLGDRFPGRGDHSAGLGDHSTAFGEYAATLADHPTRERHRPEDRYATLLDHHPDGVAVHVNGLIAYANPAMLRLAGGQAGHSLIGTPLVSYLDLGSVPELAEGIAGLAEPGDSCGPIGVTMQRLDYRTVDVEVVVVRTRWGDSPAYEIIVHDLTALRTAQAAQRQAEQYFTSVVSQLEEAVVVFDRRGIIQSANAAASRIFGRTSLNETLMGMSIFDVPIGLLDANGYPVPVSRHPVARTLATGETYSRYVFGIDRPDGQRRWLTGTSRLLTPGDPQSPAVSSFIDITEYRASRTQLEFQATHDPLTGLANRALVLSRLSAALSSEDQSVFTVLFIDLDGFKQINDTLGHAIGDTVLQIVAQRLERGLREDDVVGRIGGDEFLVLLSGPETPADVDALISRLRQTMAEPIIARGHRIHVNASIGATPLIRGDRRSPAAVLHDADEAMYRAKPAGRRESATRGRRSDTTHAS